MSELVDVRCPSCGAPLRIDPRAPFALCTHCRVQSRVERVATAAELTAPGGEGVIRVVVTSGVRLAARSFAVAGGLFALLLAMLTANYLLDSARPGLADDARFALELSQGSTRLDSYRALTVLQDGSVVIGSESGQLAFVSPGGQPAGRLDLPLPATRARLGGLAAHPSGGFYASLGGAIVHVSGPPFTATSVGPALPVDPAARVYGAIAVDAQGRLHAATTSGLLVRVEADGSASSPLPLGIPTYGRPLELGTLVFTPAGRLIVRLPYGDAVWTFDPATGALSPLTLGAESPRSSVACLASGALVYEAGSSLVRHDARGAQALELARQGHQQFDFVVADEAGGVVALSLSGTLVRYDAQRISP